MLRTSPMLFLCAACTAMLALSCGESSESTPGPVVNAAVSQAELSVKVAEALCNHVGKCCTDHGFGFDAEACASAVRADVQQSVDAAASVTGLVFHAEAAAECVQRYEELADACVYSEEQREAVLRACSSIWTGSLAQGAPCTLDFECDGASQAAAYCAPAQGGDAGATGSCAAVTAPQHGAKGSACESTCRTSTDAPACSGTGQPQSTGCWVHEGLYCDSTTGTCAELAAAGQPCSAIAPCAEGYTCKAETCTAKVPIGGACESGVADPCAQGAWCSALSKTCEALKSDGATCLESTHCASSSCHGGTCKPAMLAADEALCRGL